MRWTGFRGCFVAWLLTAVPVATYAQAVREHTRPQPDRSTDITPTQANELTLTLTEAAIRPIQIWIRTAGTADPGSRVVRTRLSASEGRLVKVGQRVRAFPPDSRSSMYQARITGVQSQRDGVAVTTTLSGQGRQNAVHYVLEIVTENLESLSVPNEAIIETGGTHVVYVEQQPGRYAARQITVGIQGELFTQVVDGLEPGEQVVTFGSFFIDADHRLKGSQSY